MPKQHMSCLTGGEVYTFDVGDSTKTLQEYKTCQGFCFDFFGKDITHVKEDTTIHVSVRQVRLGGYYDTYSPNVF